MMGGHQDVVIYAIQYGVCLYRADIPEKHVDVLEVGWLEDSSICIAVNQGDDKQVYEFGGYKTVIPGGGQPPVPLTPTEKPQYVPQTRAVPYGA
jgi:hypothetical protein